MKSLFVFSISHTLLTKSIVNTDEEDFDYMTNVIDRITLSIEKDVSSGKTPCTTQPNVQKKQVSTPFCFLLLQEIIQIINRTMPNRRFIGKDKLDHKNLLQTSNQALINLLKQHLTVNEKLALTLKVPN